MRLLAVWLALVGCGRLDFDPISTSIPPDVVAAQATIAAGYGFSCAVRDGAVWCWGRSDARQLGIDSFDLQPVPVKAALSAHVVRIAAGDAIACALDDVGAVWCWGDGALPATIAGLPLPATAIATGGDHTCAVLSDASLWCWGANSTGEVGVDPNAMPRVATPVRILDAVTAAGAGEGYTCALRADTSVWCWGQNFVGTLGDGTLTARFEPRVVPGLSAVALTTGGYHACVLDAEGRYSCWGDNAESELGIGLGVSMQLTPAAPSAVSGLVAIATGAITTCAIDGDHHVICWGNGNNGEQGDGFRYDHSTPVSVLGAAGAVALAPGYQHTCAALADGSIQCWGYGSHGELGDGRLAALVPRQVPLPGAADYVAAGKHHACARLQADQSVWCWGSNGAGELGAVDDTNPQGSSITPVEVPLAVGVSWLGGGDGHTCALASGSLDLYCWGRNDFGQDGSLPIEYAHAPTMVAGLASSNGASCTGEGFSCTYNVGGMYCWGTDDQGQLGDAGGSSSVMPRLVGQGTQPACGDTFGCSLIAGGVGCWGNNRTGALGNGGIDSSSHTLAPVAGGVSYFKVVAGSSHACAIHADLSAVDCWGLNSSGQLGDGTYITRPIPTTVIGVTGFAAIAAGGDTTCVGSGGGTLCWGANDVGQAGDGTGIARPTPVAGPAGASDIAVGDRFACAVDFMNRVACWGDNADGQIGSGIQTRSLVPVNVMFP